MQVDFDSIQPETIEHFKGGEGLRYYSSVR